MRLKKRSDDHLILRGYSWGWLALAFLFMLLTPLWVALAGELGEFEPVMIALIGPPMVFWFVWRDYDNWQLVLQSDFTEGAIYKAPWGYRQKVTGFDLSTLDKAVIDTEFHGVRKGFWRYREEKTHYLALTFNGVSYKRRVGMGTEGAVLSMISHINGWLSIHRHKLATANKKRA